MEEFSVGYMAGLAIKFYALMTPPAVLSAFITHTSGAPKLEQYRIACKCGIAIFIIGEALFLFGAQIFAVFGFTLDAFRIGVGLLLFLSAVGMMNGPDKPHKARPGTDIGVVPLALPLAMGPSAIGAVMIFGASTSGLGAALVGTGCLLLASLGMAVLLCLSGQVERLIGRTGIAVLAKLTALLLAAIASQVIFTGIKAFLKH